ncbi:hypothetical protein TNCV_2698751 [Trichonephila clavipes]|nr:hypothetical protein TNCV_2698751 [Trichonephila clavipes]
MYPWGTTHHELPNIAKVGLVSQQMEYSKSVVVKTWTKLFVLAIDRENKQVKEAIQSESRDDRSVSQLLGFVQHLMTYPLTEAFEE